MAAVGQERPARARRGLGILAHGRQNRFMPITESRQSGEAGMHTVELLEEAVQVAQRLGYRIRQEWLGGTGGGGCEIKGRKCLFLDLALSPGEQLERVVASLEGEAGVASVPMSVPLRRLIRVRKVA